ncbi:MAG TPA: TAXI family TRAP transporter solute-binding subunit [Firmicutes bacterium]|nr:TAXI family TRAP transporter solute-binding subunit [Bacillota bacterium]
MKGYRFWIAGLLLVFVLAGTVAGCGSKKTFLGLATATAGGSYYAVGGAMANLWTKLLEKEGIQVSAQASNGSVENINRMKDGQCELALVHNKVALWAQKGEVDFKDKPYKDFSAVTAVWPNVLQIVVTKDINSIQDLKGKRVVVGAINSGNETDSRLVLEFFGLNYRERKEVIPEYVGYNEAVEALKNRQVSAAVFTGGMPTSAVTDVMASAPVKILEFTSDQIKALSAKHSFYYEYTIPANTYINQPTPIRTIAYANLLVAKNSVSEEVVYKLVKSLFDNIEELTKTHNTARDIKLDTALVGVPIDFHPGAVRFFKEKGIWKK